MRPEKAGGKKLFPNDLYPREWYLPRISIRRVSGSVGMGEPLISRAKLVSVSVHSGRTSVSRASAGPEPTLGTLARR